MSSFRNAVLAAGLAACAAAAAPLVFRTRELPWAAFGAPYRTTIETLVDGRCVDGGVGLTIVSGRLPRGLDLRGIEIAGIPQEFGAFRLRVRAFNGCAAATSDLLLQVTGRPVLRTSPAEIVVEYHAGAAAPEPATLLVKSTWPGLEYAVRSGEAWLKANPQSGATPSPGSPFAGDTVQLEIVPGKLAPGDYETALVFSAANGAAPVNVPVRLRVLDK